MTPFCYLRKLHHTVGNQGTKDTYVMKPRLSSRLGSLYKVSDQRQHDALLLEGGNMKTRRFIEEEVLSL